MAWQSHVALARYAGRRRLCNGRETPERRSVRVGKDWEEPFSSATHEATETTEATWMGSCTAIGGGIKGAESWMMGGFVGVSGGNEMRDWLSVQWTPCNGRDGGVYNGKEWEAREEGAGGTNDTQQRVLEPTAWAIDVTAYPRWTVSGSSGKRKGITHGFPLLSSDNLSRLDDKGDSVLATMT
ncbi:hypothetical protein FB45DRAFT_1004083 [Roridomyces roridus]|uniref:Uncharacterized protein n=1 Tax=Roridomyces roridus TaxID=1738132 RepID=A0AAD7BRA2_9AGAR|nr:hypothetical protein FB45DRAFT_1004083 [Roridomyces roridus]